MTHLPQAATVIPVAVRPWYCPIPPRTQQPPQRTPGDYPRCMETLPCGCRHGLIDDVFVFEPHALDCKMYQYVLAEMQRQGKPHTVLDMRIP